MDRWTDADYVVAEQAYALRYLLKRASHTLQGKRYHYAELAHMADEALLAAYGERVAQVEYEDIRELTMRMLHGEKDILWPGRVKRFAQSSGTSGGKSKYIPLTDEGLRMNHFAGASDAVAAYLRNNPSSRLFSGKALILGGSFANELGSELPAGVRAGDLSATLIDRAPFYVQMMRAPSRKVALMSHWEEKLPLLINEVMKENITSLSGVPSWFLILLRRLMQRAGVDNLHELWPGLEVFFHGGISFAPYREEYRSFTQQDKMHFVETYNASEGFFAAQTNPDISGMQLLPDRGIYYEFAPMLPGGEYGAPVPLSQVKEGQVYSMIVSTPCGLWRYALGDTVKFVSTRPYTIIIAGRTHSFINAFGEELMEHNAEHAISAACLRTGSAVSNYTAGPVYAHDGKKGHHKWLIEFAKRPASVEEFARILDEELQNVNSDYQAKRAGSIFLDPPEIVLKKQGYFDAWLAAQGNGKLGGQRKIPRLCPTAESLARFN